MHVLINYNWPMRLLRNVKCKDMHLSFFPPSPKHASHLSMDVMCKHEQGVTKGNEPFTSKVTSWSFNHLTITLNNVIAKCLFSKFPHIISLLSTPLNFKLHRLLAHLPIHQPIIHFKLMYHLIIYNLPPYIPTYLPTYYLITQPTYHQPTYYQPQTYLSIT
jgi:hypothetical protein